MDFIPSASESIRVTDPQGFSVMDTSGGGRTAVLSCNNQEVWMEQCFESPPAALAVLCNDCEGMWWWPPGHVEDPRTSGLLISINPERQIGHIV